MSKFRKLKSIDLCSGIGGITHALHKYCEPILYSEIDKYCQSVLKTRIEKGDLPYAPIYGDFRNIPINKMQDVEIIVSGIPCQDFSTAGAGKGLEGKRSSLFLDVLQLSKEIKPKFLFFENVIGIRTRGLARIIKELSFAGYDSRWCSVAAAETGAPHQRRRWFCLSYLNENGCRKKAITTKKEESIWWSKTSSLVSPRWPSEPDVGRVADGIPKRMERIQSLGNSVVPAQVELAYELLLGLHCPKAS